MGDFMLPNGLSSNPAENTASDIVGRLCNAIRQCLSIGVLLSREVAKEHARMVAAEARLADANKLLRDWVAGEHPSTPEGVARVAALGHPKESIDANEAIDRAMAYADRRCIHELATILGEDVSWENVQHMLQQRASRKAREEQERVGLCICKHERALHPNGGPCIGSHRTGGCRSYVPASEAVAP